MLSNSYCYISIPSQLFQSSLIPLSLLPIHIFSLSTSPYFLITLHLLTSFSFDRVCHYVTSAPEKLRPAPDSGRYGPIQTCMFPIIPCPILSIGSQPFAWLVHLSPPHHPAHWYNNRSEVELSFEESLKIFSLFLLFWWDIIRVGCLLS